MPALVMLFALLLVACGSAEPPACPLGRVEACACPGGSQGAQECGPLGVWSACVCLGGDAGNAVAVADATPDAVVDAPDVPQDATPEITAPDVIAVADVPQDAPDDAPPERRFRRPRDRSANLRGATGDGESSRRCSCPGAAGEESGSESACHLERRAGLSERFAVGVHPARVDTSRAQQRVREA